MPEPSPAIAEADSEKVEARCPPAKPSLVTNRQTPDDQVAEPPSELVTPATARAAASAIRAWSSRDSADGSAGSKASRSGVGPLASHSLGARPP
jgi:hypothetical protein